LIISKNGFYLQKVTDTRTNKTNNGYIERDLSKRRLVFQDSLASYISSFIYPTQPKPLLVPLSIQIEKMRIFSSTDGRTDNAQIYVKLHLFDEIAHEKLRTFERTLNYKKKADPAFVGKVMYDALRIAFVGLRPKTVLRAAPVSSTTSDSSATEVLILKEEAKERNVHRIASPAALLEWTSSEFYLADVKDVRSDQRNVGMVRKGFFSQKYEAELDSGLEVYLKKSIHSTPDSSKKRLTLYVHSFQIKEEASAYGEENDLFFTGVLAYDSAGITIQMFENVVEIDTVSDKDITSQWPSLITKALSLYFQPFEEKKTRKLVPENIGQNSYFNANEIRAEKYGFRDRYFHKSKVLRGLNDFSPIFQMDVDSVNNTFATAKSLCYMGRISLAFGGTLLAWSGLDFLLSEEQSLSKWYNGEKETSTAMKFIDKKVVIKVGTAHLIGGIICNIIGKVVLDKAISMHNKSLAERVSFNLSPDIYNNGFQFHLNMLLGCR